MNGYFLQNNDGEFIKTLDTANGELEFTNDFREARNYKGRPGGGQWDAENEKYFICFHFKDKYGDKVNTLQCVYREE